MLSSPSSFEPSNCDCSAQRISCRSSLVPFSASLTLLLLEDAASVADSLSELVAGNAPSWAICSSLMRKKFYGERIRRNFLNTF